MRTYDQVVDEIRSCCIDAAKFDRDRVRDIIIAYRHEWEQERSQGVLAEIPYLGSSANPANSDKVVTPEHIGQLGARLEQVEGRLKRVEYENKADHPAIFNLGNRVSYLEAGHIRAEDGSGPEAVLHREQQVERHEAQPNAPFPDFYEARGPISEQALIETLAPETEEQEA